MRDAFRLAMSGRPGPVLIDIPMDIQMALCEYEPREPVVADAKFAAKDIRIREAADCINTSERPYLYIGGGMISSDAVDEMMDLAEKIDAPIGCSLMGLSCVPSDHPRFLGMQGMHGHYASSMSMHNADCIIALGVRFNDRVTGDKTKFSKKAKIVHIDIDGSELSKNVELAYGLRGEVKETLKKLVPLVNKAKHPDWWSRIEALRKDEEDHSDQREGMTPRNVIMTLNRHLEPNTPIATDVGQHQMWTAQYVKLQNPRRFVSSGGLGTMGFGLGAAIGAAYGTGERSVLVTGDGSFGMCLNELATAVSYQVPVVILIMNNGVLGMVRQWQTLFFDRHYSNTVLDRKTDFTALAKAFGADGEPVSDLDALDAALARAVKASGPYVIDCRIDKDEFVLPMLPPGGSMDDIILKVGD